MTFGGIINIIVGILGNVVTVLVGLALLILVWGLALTVLKSGDEKAVAQGKTIAVWGTIGLFVIVAVWGIVYLVSNSIFSQSDLEADSNILSPVIDIPFRTSI